MTDTNDRIYWLAWKSLNGVGLKALWALQDRFGSLETAWSASEADLLDIDGFGKKTVAAIVEQRRANEPHKLYADYCEANPHFWALGEPDYPRLLRECPEPPPILHYLGEPNADDLTGRAACVAVVGTRTPRRNGYGQRVARLLVRALVARGYTIVSGMAAGIDSIAHETCLQMGGRTIAVFGTGVDVVYPRSNQRLYDAIRDRGAILSEYPVQTKPLGAHFPARNRIIAGLCRATIVIEAPDRSGARIAGRLSTEYGRETFVVPGEIDDPQFVGGHQLLASGTAQCIASPEHLIEMLDGLPGLDPHRVAIGQRSPDSIDSPNSIDSPDTAPLAPIPPDLAEPLRRVLECITREPTSIDRIAADSGLAGGEVLATLSQLELLDFIERLDGGTMYRRCN